MDILGIMDPDLHENLCGFETLPASGTAGGDIYCWTLLPELVKMSRLQLWAVAV